MHKFFTRRRKKKIINAQLQSRPKKKLSCWQKCRRRICRGCRNWLCRRIKRCLKRLLFGKKGTNFKKVGDYERGTATKTSVILYGSGKQSKKGFAIKDALVNDLDAYALPKSTGKKIKSFVNEIRENYLNLSKYSIFNFNDQEKQSPKDLSVEYEKKNKSSVITLFRNKEKSANSIVMKHVQADKTDGLKSQDKKIKSIVDNLRENNLYIGLSKDSKLNLSAKDKEKFKNLAEKYEKKNKLYPQKDLEYLEDIIKLKQKLSITPSKAAKLQNMVKDYEMRKFSFTQLPNKSKLKIDTLSKKQLSEILAHYEAEQKRKHSTFVKQSKLKQLKSDLREKINFI